MGNFIGFFYEILVLGSCIAAIVFNVLLMMDCEFFTIIQLDSPRKGQGSLGLFEWQIPGEHENCVQISPIADGAVEDNSLRCARWSSALALIFGVLLFTFGVFKQCLIPLPCTQCFMDLASISIQICLGLVYVIYWCDICDTYACSSGTGTTYLIVTQICWLVAGFFSRYMRRGRWERRDEIRAQRQQKEEQKAAEAAEEELEKAPEKGEEHEEQQESSNE